MSQHILPAPAVVTPRIDRRAPERVFRFVLNRFLLLPFGAIIALVWANTDAEGYFRFSQRLAFPVNEIAMAFFLGLIGQEVFEEVMPDGALHTWRQWSLPVVGAIGGFAGAAAMFVGVVTLSHETVLADAWPIACAVDVAAGYYVLRLIYPRRSSILPFLLLLALVTDATVLAIATVRTPGFSLHPGGGAVMLAALIIAVMLRRNRVRSFWPYLIGCGTLSWLGLYWMGIHPALALVPLVPLLPHSPRKLDLFADRLDADPVHHAEHEWNGVAQIALFLFGLVNAGVILRHSDTGTWAVLTAALAGRPLGIMAAIGIAVAAGLHLPRWMNWRDMLVVALATTSGFTFALFLAAALLPLGAVAEQITLGALSTVAGAVITLVVAWLLGTGRFAVGSRRH